MSYDIKPSIFFIANLMNFVLATGIFTLPFSLYECGIVLGSIILVIICAISIIACTFIIEALGTENFFLKIGKIALSQNDDMPHDNESTFDKEAEILIFHNNEKNEVLLDLNCKKSVKKVIKKNEVENFDKREEDDKFFIFKRVEITKMSNKVLSKPVKVFVVIIMVCYLYIGLISNGMIAGKSLFSILSKSMGYQLSNHCYLIIVVCFYALVVIIAMNDIKHLKKLSVIVMIIRFIIIFLILGSCIYSIIQNGGASFSDIPKVKMPQIGVMIGNSLFLFMSHHSIPGMVENFKPQKNLIKLIVIAYICSLIIMLGYGYIALFAFGHLTNCETEVFPCAIQSTFSLNFISFNVVGYIINYYPLLNVITTALMAITLKNNILQSIGDCSQSFYKKLNFSEKKGCLHALMSILFNMIMCLPSLLAAILLEDIQELMKYFSSIFGFFILLVVPTVLVYGFRKKFQKMKMSPGKLNRSFLQHNESLVVIGGLGIAILSLIIYSFLYSDNKTCVAKKD